MTSGGNSPQGPKKRKKKDFQLHTPPLAVTAMGPLPIMRLTPDESRDLGHLSVDIERGLHHHPQEHCTEKGKGVPRAALSTFDSFPSTRLRPESFYCIHH